MGSSRPGNAGASTGAVPLRPWKSVGQGPSTIAARCFCAFFPMDSGSTAAVSFRSPTPRHAAM